jgi:large subunit ribosomal protein L18
MTTATLEKARRRTRRRTRIRGKVSGTAERPRLSIYRSNRGVFAQLINDSEGRTLAAVSWTEPDLRNLASMEKATRAGELLAQRARDVGLEQCVFDRGGYRFHGRVKSLAEGARSGGLKF